MVFKEDNKCEMTYPGSKHGGEGITAISTYSQNKNVVLVTSHSIVYQDGTEQIDSNPSTTELYVVENGLKYSGSTSEDAAAGYYPFLEIQSKTL